MELCQITNSDITVLFAVIESGHEIYLSSPAQTFGRVRIKQVTLNVAKEVAQYKRTRIKHRIIGVECAEFSSVVNNARITLFLSTQRYGLVVDGDDVLRQLLNNALTLHDYLITALGKES
jgi:hypothetical protein